MKRYFNTRTTREKMLLIVLAGLAAVIWLASTTGRARRLAVEWRITRAELREQDAWLGQKAAVARATEEAIRHLDPSRTYNGTRLVGEVNRLAMEAGLSPAVDSPRTESTDEFAYNSLQVMLRRADLASLMRLNEAIEARSPYIGMEQIMLMADRNNPSLLDARLRLFSVELAKTAK